MSKKTSQSSAKLKPHKPLNGSVTKTLRSNLQMLPKVTKKKTQKSKKRTQKSTGTWSRALKRKFWRFCVCVECICVRVAAGIATDLSSHRAADDERRRDAPRYERIARRKPNFRDKRKFSPNYFLLVGFLTRFKTVLLGRYFECVSVIIENY